MGTIGNRARHQYKKSAEIERRRWDAWQQRTTQNLPADDETRVNVARSAYLRIERKQTREFEQNARNVAVRRCKDGQRLCRRVGVVRGVGSGQTRAVLRRPTESRHGVIEFFLGRHVLFDITQKLRVNDVDLIDIAAVSRAEREREKREFGQGRSTANMLIAKRADSDVRAITNIVS